jgi:hypothetical protein
MNLLSMGNGAMVLCRQYFLSHDKLSQRYAIVACHNVADTLNPAHNDEMSLVMKMSLMSHSYQALVQCRPALIFGSSLSSPNALAIRILVRNEGA